MITYQSKQSFLSAGGSKNNSPLVCRLHQCSSSKANRLLCPWLQSTLRSFGFTDSAFQSTPRSVKDKITEQHSVLWEQDFKMNYRQILHHLCELTENFALIFPEKAICESWRKQHLTLVRTLVHLSGRITSSPVFLVQITTIGIQLYPTWRSFLFLLETCIWCNERQMLFWILHKYSVPSTEARHKDGEFLRQKKCFPLQHFWSGGKCHPAASLGEQQNSSEEERGREKRASNWRFSRNLVSWAGKSWRPPDYLSKISHSQRTELTTWMWKPSRLCLLTRWRTFSMKDLRVNMK